MLVVSGFLVVLAASPQEPADGRDAAFGIARRADRSPWQGATVRLVSEPFLGADRDEVVVTTDESGRFRARILVGLPYVALVFSRDGEVWRVSQRVTDAVPRLPIVLDEHHTEPCVRLRVNGLAAWNLERATVWIAGTADGRLASPAVATSDAAVELEPTGTGYWWFFLQTGTGLDAIEQRVPDDPRDEFVWTLPSPRPVAVTVATPSGKPVEDARLEIRRARATTLPQRSDAAGKLTISLPDGFDPRARGGFWCVASGHLESRLWAIEFASTPIRAFVTPQVATAPVIGWRANEPIADLPVWVGGVEQAVLCLPREKNGHAHPQFAVNGFARTNAKGVVWLGYETSSPITIAAALPRIGLEVLERQHGGPISPLALLHARVGDRTSGSLRVDALRPVQFVFEHHDHAPAPRAHVRLGGGASPGLGIEYVADQASSITVLLPPQDDIVVAAWHDGAGDVVKVAVPRAQGDGIARVRVTLPAPIRIVGTVVDVDGDPVANATVVTTQTLRGESSEWQPVEMSAENDAPRIVAHGWYYPPMCERMFARKVTTGADGRFEFLVPGRGYPLELCAHAGPRRGEIEWRDAEAASDREDEVLVKVR